MSAAALILRSYIADPNGALLRMVRPIYAEVFAEPPYGEGPAEVEDFVAYWQTVATQPGFRLVLVFVCHQLIGFAFGVPMDVEADWWDGLLDPVTSDETSEYPGRTFVVRELAVRLPHRRRGIGHYLHQSLLAERPEERVTLLVRPEAEAAHAAYTAWGYRSLGRLRPDPEAPVYIAMIRNLPLKPQGPSNVH
jgi:GNAT superfamily N-acetyltransferase